MSFSGKFVNIFANTDFLFLDIVKLLKKYVGNSKKYPKAAIMDYKCRELLKKQTRGTLKSNAIYNIK